MTIPRPAKPPRWADNVSAGMPGRVEPSEARKDDGYDHAMQPAAGGANWLFGHISDWIQYADRAIGAMRSMPRVVASDKYAAGSLGNEIRVVPEPAAGAPPILLAQSGASLVFSYDGIHWLAIANAPSQAVRALAVDTTVSPNRVLLALGVGSDIEYTQDVRDGTWTSRALPAGTPYRIAWANGAEGQRSGVVATDAGDLYRFVDITDASPFAAPTTAPPAGLKAGFAFAPRLGFDRWVVVGVADLGTGQPFAYSDDLGDNWTLCTPIPGIDPDGGDNQALAWLPEGGTDGLGRFFAMLEEGTTNPNPRLFESVDGDTWTDVSERIDWFYEQGQWGDSVGELTPLSSRAIIGTMRPTDGSGRGAVISTDGGVTRSPIYLPDLELGTGGNSESAVAFKGEIVISGEGDDVRKIWLAGAGL